VISVESIDTETSRNALTKRHSNFIAFASN
jgi:hypothetical protein